MNQLKLNGSVEFLGIDLPVIEGGFGDDKRCILAKDIAEIHSRELREINERINLNRKRFKDNIDIINLKSIGQTDRDLLVGLGFSNSSIANAKNIYLLSERGYSKLIKILDDDKAWEMHDELVDHYFALREQVKLTLTASEQAILNIVQAKGELATAMAIKEYENVVTEPLRLEVDKYERFICDKLSTLTKKELADKLDTKFQTLAALFKKLEIYTPTSQVHTKILKRFPDVKMIKIIESEFNNPKTGKKQIKTDWQWTGEGAKVIVDYLLELGYVKFTENKGFKLVNSK